jgi:hypothetical protein
MKDAFTINVKLSEVTRRLAALTAYTQPIYVNKDLSQTTAENTTDFCTYCAT